jgi:hypothetical protein
MKHVLTPPVLDAARRLAAGFEGPREDRVIGPDVHRAEASLPELAAAVRGVLAT